MLLVIRDDSLTVTKLGELTDMSGTNDAFNSSICSLEVISIHFFYYILVYSFVCFGFEHLFHFISDQWCSSICSLFVFFVFFLICSFIWLFVPRWFLFVRIFCSSPLCFFYLFDHSFLLFVFAIVYSFIRSLFLNAFFALFYYFYELILFILVKDLSLQLT